MPIYRSDWKSVSFIHYYVCFLQLIRGIQNRQHSMRSDRVALFAILKKFELEKQVS